MIRCKYCGNTHEDYEIDEENYTCHQCGMPIGYTGDDNESTEEDEINDFFTDEEDDDQIVDPDALTDEDLAELMKGSEDYEDIDFDDAEFEDDDDEGDDRDE